MKQTTSSTGQVPEAKVKSVLFAQLSGLSTDNIVKIQHWCNSHRISSFKNITGFVVKNVYISVYKLTGAQ